MKKTNSNITTTSVRSNISNASEKKHYLVTAKCGHVRKANYIPIDFPVSAANGKEAAAIARQLPRVKHDHTDAIIAVREVSSEDFNKQVFINKNDPFLRITNRRDHEALSSLFEDRIQPEREEAPYKSSNREDSHKVIRFGKERIRNPKKWARMNEAA